MGKHRNETPSATSKRKGTGKAEKSNKKARQTVEENFEANGESAQQAHVAAAASLAELGEQCQHPLFFAPQQWNVTHQFENNQGLEEKSLENPQVHENNSSNEALALALAQDYVQAYGEFVIKTRTRSVAFFDNRTTSACPSIKFDNNEGTLWEEYLTWHKTMALGLGSKSNSKKILEKKSTLCASEYQTFHNWYSHYLALSPHVLREERNMIEDNIYYVNAELLTKAYDAYKHVDGEKEIKPVPLPTFVYFFEKSMENNNSRVSLLVRREL